MAKALTDWPAIDVILDELDEHDEVVDDEDDKIPTLRMARPPAGSRAALPPVVVPPRPRTTMPPPASAKSPPVSAKSPPASAKSLPVSAKSPPVSAKSLPGPPVSAKSPPVSATLLPVSAKMPMPISASHRTVLPPLPKTRPTLPPRTLPPPMSKAPQSAPRRTIPPPPAAKVETARPPAPSLPCEVHPEPIDLERVSLVDLVSSCPPVPWDVSPPRMWDVVAEPPPPTYSGAPSALSVPPLPPPPTPVRLLVSLALGVTLGVASFLVAHVAGVGDTAATDALPTPAVLAANGANTPSGEPAAKLDPVAAPPPPVPERVVVPEVTVNPAALPPAPVPGPLARAARPASAPLATADTPAEPTKPVEPEPVAPAPVEPADGPAFPREAAAAAIASAAQLAATCTTEGAGNSRVRVTFAPSGRATQAVITGDLSGTAVGSCMAQAFATARIPAFSGEAVAVTRRVQ